MAWCPPRPAVSCSAAPKPSAPRRAAPSRTCAPPSAPWTRRCASQPSPLCSEARWRRRWSSWSAEAEGASRSSSTSPRKPSTFCAAGGRRRLIFRHGPGEAIPSGHRAVVLGVDRHALILPRRWGLDRDVRELADAEDLPWVAGCRRCTQHLTQVCEAAGFTPAIRHVTDDPQAIQALVAHGLGVALIPRLALRTPGATGFADRLDVVDLPQLVPREITAVHPESWTGTARLDELISALRGRL
ncbi:LysR substrate-binding domain-containing protein [Nesterenkonia sp. PF2B19]|uniref:LysR substrate-binding domain-containing protein n=1 Tax=Nesterenkonia sp. PF2B19 TaxID=1881858 RepID=UPI000A19E422|nr:LysR substrate-binding domain-containing protein [Nesterenkonia sp. PF2B19]OSM43338.1 hypothetical protein BCY76_009130 [Nesterenkonia sp. PF2B19]